MNPSLTLAILFSLAAIAATGCAAAPDDDTETDAIEAEATDTDDEADENVAEAEEALMACTGDADCNDMFSGPGCNGGAVCIDNWCFCW